MSVALRAVLAATFGFGVDEAYAVAVARPWSLSYFDHPPLHFWMIGAATQFVGAAPFVVRALFVLCSALTLANVAAIARWRGGDIAARWSALLLASCGVLGVVHGTLALPDGPLIAALTTGVRLLLPALLDDDSSLRGDGGRWCAGGVAFAFALLSKYHAALVLGGLAVFVLAHARTRRVLRSPMPWVAAAVALAGMLPAAVWNAQHEWASFAFQSSRAASTSAWSPAPFAEQVAAQVAWLLPWVAVPLVWACGRAVRVRRDDPWVQLMLSLALFPIVLFFGVTVLGTRALPHWQAPGWLFLFPLAGVELARAAPRWVQRVSIAAPVATGAVLGALVVFARVHPPAESWAARARAPLADLVSWRPLFRHVSPRSDTVYTARSWIQAGQLGSALHEAGVHDADVRCLCVDARHFGYRAPRDSAVWRHAVLVDRVHTSSTWQPIETIFADSAWRITVRDTAQLDANVRVVRYLIER